MGKKKTETKTKGAQLVIRVDREERDAFVELCERIDTSAAREIRRFMREWVANNQPTIIPEPETGLSEGGQLATNVATGETAAPELSAENVRKTRNRTASQA